MIIRTTIKDSFTLGQVIQQSRLRQGLSQRDLAGMLGISQKWVWEMEQGKPGILMERLFMILEKTGVTLAAEFDAEREIDLPENKMTGSARKEPAPENRAASFLSRLIPGRRKDTNR